MSRFTTLWRRSRIKIRAYYYVGFYRRWRADRLEEAVSYRGFRVSLLALAVTGGVFRPRGRRPDIIGCVLNRLRVSYMTDLISRRSDLGSTCVTRRWQICYVDGGVV